MSGPRPAEQPGVVVRIRMSGSHCYTSKRMTLDQAHGVKTSLVKRFGEFPEGLLDVPEFPCPELEELAVNAARVTGVEVRRVNGDGGLVRGQEPSS